MGCADKKSSSNTKKQSTTGKGTKTTHTKQSTKKGTKKK